MKAVAARVGYSSRSSFTRAFLGSHHVGPTAFRLEGRGEPMIAESVARKRAARTTAPSEGRRGRIACAAGMLGGRLVAPGARAFSPRGPC